MPLDDFRAVYFPYCIEKQDDGTYVVLNREYKPVGFNTRDWINYSDYPVGVRLRLTPKRIDELSVDDNDDGSNVYLYDDSTNPIRSKKNMDAYLEKLRILAKLEIS